MSCHDLTRALNVISALLYFENHGLKRHTRPQYQMICSLVSYNTYSLIYVHAKNVRVLHF